MSEKIDQIVEDLKTLTLLEASELVSKIEETFGVDASASLSGPAMVMATTTEMKWNDILSAGFCNICRRL